MYLKLITEAIHKTSEDKGCLRRDIWDYLNGNYPDRLDYREFLRMIQQFAHDGKLLNEEGIYKIDRQVLEEVKKNTPTPVF